MASLLIDEIDLEEDFNTVDFKTIIEIIAPYSIEKNIYLELAIDYFIFNTFILVDLIGGEIGNIMGNQKQALENFQKG